MDVRKLFFQCNKAVFFFNVIKNYEFDLTDSWQFLKFCLIFIVSKLVYNWLG